MNTKKLNGNQLKVIAMIAMLIDHLVYVIFPNYPTDWWIILLHIVGRLAAPIFWFFIAEGYTHTKNVKKYAIRLLIFAVISHFAHNFAFGIPFIPFKTSVFNQTSVIWSLFWGLIAIVLMDKAKLPKWQKTLIFFVILAVSFCADWSCIAVLAIFAIWDNRGNFKRQMTFMMIWVAMYAVIFAIFINPTYGIIQLFVALTIPLLYSYNGEKGKCKSLKYIFYIFYPLHLIICGIIRIALHGNVSVLIGG